MEIKREDLKLRGTLPENLKNKIEMIEKKIEPVLNKTTGINYAFTDHGLPHSVYVEKIYDEILNNDCTKLSEEEKFLLICATLLHDIGMVGEAQYAQEPNYAVEIRDAHHINTREIINIIYDNFNLNKGEADFIAEIAEAHRGIPLEEINEHDFIGVGKKIRLRLLSALLRMADELHLTYDRTDNIIRKIIKPGIDSMKHHEKHLAIQGIGRENDDIIVSATAKRWDVEDELIKCEAEVNKKLVECKETFNKYNIILNSVTFIIKVIDIIKKEIILIIADNSREMSINEIYEQQNIKFANKNRKKSNVERAIKDLTSEHILIKNHEKYKLNKNERKFRELLDTFLDTKYELDFIQSLYIKEYLKENLREYARNNFGYYFKDGELEDRFLILNNSPTAIKYIFSDKHMRCESGIIEKKAIFDLSLLQGYTVDSILYPSIAEDNDAKLAVQAINLTLGSIINNFIGLIGALPKTIEEKKERMEYLIKNDINTEESHDTPVKTLYISSYTTSETPSYGDFASIILASEKTGLPIHIAKNIDVKSNELLPDEIIFNKNTCYLELTPMIPACKYPVIRRPCKLLSDERLGILTIVVPQNVISCKMKDYPYFLDVEFKTRKKVSLDLSFYSDTSAKDLLLLEGYFNQINKQVYRRLILNLDNGETIYQSVPPTFIKSNLQIEKYKLLAQLEKLLEEKIPSGYYMNKNTLDKLYMLLRNCKNSKDAKDYYNNIYINSNNNKKTNIYTTLKSDNSILLMKHEDISGILNYNILNMVFFDPQFNKTWKKEYVKANKGFNLAIGLRNFTPVEIYKKLEQIFSHNSRPLEMMLHYFYNEPVKEIKDLTYRTLVNVNFKDKRQEGLFDIQDVNIEISDINETYKEINDLESLLKIGNYIQAIPLLKKHKNHKNMIEILAFAYYINEQYEKSIETANEAIKRDKSTFAYFTNGLSYLSSGKYSQAFESYSNGISKCKWTWEDAKENFENLINQMPELQDKKEVGKIKSLFAKNPTGPAKRYKSKNK